MNDNICPACGFHKELPDKPVCFYCYFRSTKGGFKLWILKIFSEHNKLSVRDLVKILNDSKMFKKEVKENAVRDYLAYLTEQGLLTKSKDRHKTGGRPRKLCKITQRGKRRLARYEKRWRQGMVVMIRRKAKKFKDKSERAAAIRGKIGKEYQLYKYLLPTRTF